MSEPAESTPGSSRVQPRATERRGWFSHGLAALAISALGLVVAGSLTTSTSAETTRTTSYTELSSAAGQQAQGGSGGQPAGAVPGLGAGQPETSEQDQARALEARGLQAFVPTQESTDTAEDRVRAAVVKERAAQRSEELTKTAEDVSRLIRTESSKARAKDLAATDREIRETAVVIAAERRQRALATRLAAEMARKQAEAAAAAAAAEAAAAAAETALDDPPPPTTDPGAPTGGGPAASPVPGAVIGSPFGATGLWARYHTGLDMRAAQGTPIRSVQSGVVLFAGNKGNWSGNHVAIRHSDGMTTMSSHMSSMAVSTGQTVSAGQVIGRVGQTGRAFGAHLHFELYPAGVRYGDVYSAVNPVPWLRSQGVRTQ